MQQQRKLHVQEKDEQRQKQHPGQLLQDAVDEDAQPQKAVAQDDAQHQNEDAQHQNEDAQALKEEDVDKLPNPSFFQFFILTNCKLSLVRQHQ